MFCKILLLDFNHTVLPFLIYLLVLWLDTSWTRLVWLVYAVFSSKKFDTICIEILISIELKFSVIIRALHWTYGRVQFWYLLFRVIGLLLVALKLPLVSQSLIDQIQLLVLCSHVVVGNFCLWKDCWVIYICLSFLIFWNLGVSLQHESVWKLMIIHNVLKIIIC